MPHGSVFPEFDVDPIIKRQDFPEDFKFGVGSSAYQIEGAYHSDGKALHIWDCHAQRNPDKILDGSNACVTVDGYHRIKEDVQLLKKMGLNYYRFSIAWSRVLPGGKVGMGKNQEGIDYYNNLINELQANGIEPFVTLYHWDLPIALEEEYMGFLSTKIIDDFVNYAELCFWEFGDRVKHWTTFNEPYRFIFGGYVDGGFAPGRGGKNKDGVIENGDPETEPYIVAANLLNAHAKAYHLYQDNFKTAQKGEVGITLDINGYKPLDSSNPNDIKAVEYAYDFTFGWFMEPLTTGTWPKNMLKFANTPSLNHPERKLHEFTDEEKTKLIKSYDFLGINYYTANFAKYNELPAGTLSDGYNADSRYTGSGQILDKDGNVIGVIGPEAYPGAWVFLCPNELAEVLLNIKKQYNVEKHIVITENGAPELKNPLIPDENGELKETFITYEQAKDDVFRLKYLKWHLDAIKRVNEQATVNNKPLVSGYFAWSFTDSYEWNSGYTLRFGMNYVDYNNNLSRYPKNSAIWFKKFLAEKPKLYEPIRKRGLISIEQEDEPMNGTPLITSGRPIEAIQKLKKAKA